MLEDEKSFNNHIAKIRNSSKICRTRDLTIEGKIVILKSPDISIIMNLVLIKTVPIFTTEQLNIIKKNFIWQKKKPKIKRSTLCNSYKNGGVKDIDIFYKIISLQCSWIRRFSDNNFRDWKVIPLFLIKKDARRKF